MSLPTHLLQVTELEVNMNSVERLVEYHTQEEEAPSHTAPGPPPGWPSAGAIEARALVVAYRAGLPPVLKGLSFSIAGRHKVGICGRTGEGRGCRGWKEGVQGVERGGGGEGGGKGRRGRGRGRAAGGAGCTR